MTAAGEVPGIHNPGQGFRSGYVAIVGPPNAGKSTLLNRILSYPVSIVAPRPQTTRHRILGILNGEGYQALFLDTPGMLRPGYKLQELMTREVDAALVDADLVVVMVCPEHLAGGEQEETGRQMLARVRDRVPLVVVNKIDIVKAPTLLPQIDGLRRQGFERIYLVSALKGSGVEDLVSGITSSLPEGTPFYPPDQVSERPERFFAAELVREAIFNRYGEEVPYSTTVVVDEFREREGRKDFIRAVVYVERQSQKAIIIGKGGEALKRVGAAARKRIEQFLGRPVFLELHVKVAEDWRRNEHFIRDNVYGA